MRPSGSQNLVVEISRPPRTGLRALDDISFPSHPARSWAWWVKSGAGKSLTGAAIIGLLEPPGRVAGGQILLEASASTTWATRDAHIRGRRIGRHLSGSADLAEPAVHVGRQLTETILAHLPVNAAEARQRAIQLLKDTGIPAAEAAHRPLPAPVLGGMRQRVVIALAWRPSPS